MYPGYVRWVDIPHIYVLSMHVPMLYLYTLYAPAVSSPTPGTALCQPAGEFSHQLHSLLLEVPLQVHGMLSMSLLASSDFCLPSYMGIGKVRLLQVL